MSTQISVPIREFTNAVKAVTPHAAARGDVPLLNAVQLVADRDALYLTATDRFTVATYRIEVAGDRPKTEVTVPVDDLKRIVSWFKAPRGQDPDLAATLTRESDSDPGTLTVSTVGLVDMPEATLTITGREGQYPPMGKIFAPAVQNAGTPSELLAVSPSLMAKFAQVPGRDPLLAWPTGPGKPWIVRVGESFIGAIMPVRTTDEPEVGMSDEWLTALTRDMSPAANAAVA